MRVPPGHDVPPADAPRFPASGGRRAFRMCSMPRHMTAFIEFFCNVCNPSAQRREEGDELATGYVRVLDGRLPEHDSVPPGWLNVRGLGPSEFGHVCGDCIDRGKAPADPYTPPTPLEKHDSGWPSRSSPFGA